MIFSVFLIVIICNQKPYAQSLYYEGKLIYANEFRIKDSTNLAIYLSKMQPSKTVRYFKDGNSFETYNKGQYQTHLYLESESKIYQKKWSNDTLYMFDCYKKGREIINLSTQKNADTILGFPCDKLELRYKNGSTTYYYNRDVIKINPKWYSRLTFINWHEISLILQSLPLKTVIEGDSYSLTSTVTSIIEQKVSDDIFKISLGSIIIEDE